MKWAGPIGLDGSLLSDPTIIKTLVEISMPVHMRIEPAQFTQIPTLARWYVAVVSLKFPHEQDSSSQFPLNFALALPNVVDVCIEKQARSGIFP